MAAHNLEEINVDKEQVQTCKMPQHHTHSKRTAAINKLQLRQMYDVDKSEISAEPSARAINTSG